MLEKGIYEELVNLWLSREIKDDKNIKISADKIDSLGSSRLLSLYFAEKLEIALKNMPNTNGNISSKVKLVNELLEKINVALPDGRCNCIIDPPEILYSVVDNSHPGGNTKNEVSRPATSIAYSSLFTGSIAEPRLYSELKLEIITSDAINMLVSFIKWSGLRLILNALKSFTERGGKLNVITTTYMGATDLKSIEELSKLNNTTIKISYDTKNTRLHAKTYIFMRKTGFSTAYVGSSNLSNAAISGGLEWNVKVAGKDMPEMLVKIRETFDTYWHSDSFTEYTKDNAEELKKALNKEINKNREADYIFDIKPYDYQSKILDGLEADRKLRGNYRNLVVSATGTGKTVISAFDYKRFEKMHPGKSRLLFIAHREEILKQSLQCFRSVLKNYNFGELYTGNYKPASMEHLFMSVQTFNSIRPDHILMNDYYNFIVIDEFHHAPAKSYKPILEYFKPDILLGLTATPERMDGKDILKYFNNHITSEIRLPEAIDKGILSPFQYFGITDSVDLDKISWSRGRYDTGELERLYTSSGNMSDERASLIKEATEKYISDLNDLKGLGFCVSVAHAEFMADYFNRNGISAIALKGNSKQEERDTAHEQLRTGKIKIIFAVDIYNEGIDIPEINTILFLRPTESLTVFIQQLGRGLRLSDGKECLTVLDFVGRSNAKYNFTGKFLSLVRNHGVSIKKEIISGFMDLPRGCYIELERKAQEYILENIEKLYSSKNGLITRIKEFKQESDIDLTLANFLEFYHINPEDIYIRNNFSRLCVLAGIKKDFHENIEEILTKAMKRVCQINSYSWIKTVLEKLLIPETIFKSNLSDQELKMADMFYFTIWNKPIKESGFSDSVEAINSLRKYPVLYSELKDLLDYLMSKIDFVEEALPGGPKLPLKLYSSYSKNQVLAAMGIENPISVREGVKYIPEKHMDILFVTLNKSEKYYSSTTMYNDYAIDSELFHWETQSTVSPHSPTAERYFHSQDNRNTVLLFIREFRENLLGASPYIFLGRVRHKNHSGSNPVSIIWKMEKPIPKRYLEITNNMLPA